MLIGAGDLNALVEEWKVLLISSQQDRLTMRKPVKSPRGGYPFDREGPLCPLLDDGDFLLEAFVRAEAKIAVKRFCKRHAWPNKPKVGFSVDDELLKKLLLSLFNCPEGRRRYDHLAAKGRFCPLPAALVLWFAAVNPRLSVRMLGALDAFMEDPSIPSPEDLSKLVAELKEEKTGAAAVTQLARGLLGILIALGGSSEQDKLARAFLEVFPNFERRFGYRPPDPIEEASPKPTKALSEEDGAIGNSHAVTVREFRSPLSSDLETLKQAMADLAVAREKAINSLAAIEEDIKDTKALPADKFDLALKRLKGFRKRRFEFDRDTARCMQERSEAWRDLAEGLPFETDRDVDQLLGLPKRIRSAEDLTSLIDSLNEFDDQFVAARSAFDTYRRVARELKQAQEAPLDLDVTAAEREPADPVPLRRCVEVLEAQTDSLRQEQLDHLARQENLSATQERLAALRQEVIIAEWHEVPAAALTPEDLEALVSDLEPGEERIAELAATLVYLLLKAGLEDGVIALADFLERHEVADDINRRLLGYLPLELLKQISTDDRQSWSREPPLTAQRTLVSESASLHRRVARAIAFCALAETMVSGHLEILSYLRTELESPRLGRAQEFFAAVIKAFERGDLREANQLLNLCSDSGETSSAELARQRLLDLVANPPGMTGLYRRLRMVAWDQFFRPLADAILAGDLDALRRTLDRLQEERLHEAWTDILAEAALSRRPTGRHESQTVRYLKEGRRRLEAHLDEVSLSEEARSSAAMVAVTRAWQRLRRSPDAAFCTDRWLEHKILTLCERTEPLEDAQSEQHFGFGIQVGGDHKEDVWLGPVTAFMPRSYLHELLGEPVPVRMVASDLLMLRGSRPVPQRLFEHYRQGAGVWGALEALEEPELQAVPTLRQQADEIREECAKREQDLARRQTVARSKLDKLVGADGGDVEGYLAEAATNFEKRDFRRCGDWLELAEQELSQLSDEAQERRQRAQVVEWLGTVGVDFAAAAPLSNLLALKEAALEETQARRSHLNVLRKRYPDLPAELTRRLAEMAGHLEEPSFWPPNAEISGDIELYLEEILGGLQEWFQRLPALAEGKQRQLPQIASFLVLALPGTVDRACEGDAGMHELAALADAPWRGGDTDELVKVLAESDLGELLPARSDEPRDDEVERLPGWPNLAALAVDENLAEIPPVGPSALLESGRWVAASRAAANAFVIRRDAGQADDAVARDALASYALSRLLTRPDLPRQTLVDALHCAASRLSRLGLKPQKANDLLRDATWLVLGEVDASLMKNEGWKDISQRESEDPGREFLSHLLDGPLADQLLSVLWNKGKAAEFGHLRVEVLNLLVQDERWSTLDDALELAPPELRLLLRNFLAILRQTPSADAEATRHANLLKIAEKVEGVSRTISGKVPYKPWTGFVRDNAKQLVSREAVERVECESGELEAVGKRRWLLRLSVTTRPVDHPSELRLHLPEDAPLAIEGGVYEVAQHKLDSSPVEEDVYLVEVGGRLSEHRSLPLDLRCTGTTLTGESIRQEFALEVQLGSAEPFDRPSRMEIEDAFPGVVGNPVTAGKGFFGRRGVLDVIETALAQGKSRWITGMRKIGKTSLLLQAIQSFAHPANRPVAAIYFPVQRGLDGGEEDLERSFFRKLLCSVDSDRNRPLVEYLEEHGVDPGEVRRRMDESLARPGGDLAQWIQDWRDALRDLSGGRLSSLAFLFDEIEWFESLWREGQRSEVRSLLATLRTVVQHVDGVSLILAGSDVANRFVKDYEQPLYASIEVSHIGGFDSRGELEDARNVFHPATLRPYFQVADDVLEYALEVCDGVPYFLSLLGSEVAILADHRRVMKSRVDRAAKSLVWGRHDASDRDRHFKFLKAMHDLQVLGHYGRVRAEVYLCCLAKETSLAFPLVREKRVRQTLKGLCPFVDEAEWREARKDCLETARLIVRQGGGLRFRIPIMGEALRRSYDESIDSRVEILEQLHASAADDP